MMVTYRRLRKADAAHLLARGAVTSRKLPIRAAHLSALALSRCAAAEAFDVGDLECVLSTPGKSPLS